MVLKNVLIYTEEKKFIVGAVRSENGYITQVWLGESAEHITVDAEEEEVIDGFGAYLIPGMIDIHLHGCRGFDFCDGTMEAVGEIAKYQASIGVTTFAPATMTLPLEQLKGILQTGAGFVKEKQQGKHLKCADLAGINMEGPFISKEKKGAQNKAHILLPDAAVFDELQQAADGLVKYIGIAPEIDGAMEFIRQVRGQTKISIAHSNADYKTARGAFNTGASHVTHLYNAMPAFNHREPGIVGAVADCGQVEAELICDGVHVHPAVIRSTFALLGADRIIMISDSMRATGMQEGEYELGGQKVMVQGERALLPDGTIAGSVTSLPDCFRYAVRDAGILLEDAVACVTVKPAKSLGIYQECGSIAVGKRADMVLLSKKLETILVVKNGLLL